MLQPYPRFYIIRPQGSFVPLIPVDELPTWIQVGNWDWNDMSLFTAMAPASFSSIPRIGEYDVVCHHCSASLDSLHRSVSEQSGKTRHSSQYPPLPLTKPNKTYAGAFLSQSSQEALSPLASSYLMSLKQPLFYTSGYPACFTEPPYYANLQSPFVGVCFIKGICQRRRERTNESISLKDLRKQQNRNSQELTADEFLDPEDPPAPANLPSAPNPQTAAAGLSAQGQPQSNQAYDPDEITEVNDNVGNAPAAPLSGDEIQEMGGSLTPASPSKSKQQNPAREEPQPVPIPPKSPLRSAPQEHDHPATRETQPVPIQGASSGPKPYGSNYHPKHKTGSHPNKHEELPTFPVDQSLIFPHSPSDTSLDSRLRIGTQSARYEDMDLYDISRRSCEASPQTTKSPLPQASSKRRLKARGFKPFSLF
ncbi:hypothetical protein ABOM_005932 [Aspergillus bombycis]|uniref:Uncharacterized protein n=1 Tax=Aspergillus bombycis TaxID=109264 RepID=A0A1F7ZXY5_9EURO|nr:hypothetical protein ABOM_005932 [Aspergillus bombycis]OGM43908.1 hypothetical protein ABOM_005932 [Aspergillus bombycis]